MIGRSLRVLGVGCALAVTFAGAPPAWATQDTATHDTAAPTAPANLRVVERTLSTIRLAWDASTDNVGVAGYVVYNGDVQIDWATGTSHLLWSLTAGTAFNLHVRALDDASNMSAPSNSVRASTLTDTEPPTVPGDLRIRGQSSTGVWLSWTASSDDDGGSGRIDYLVDDGIQTHTVQTRIEIHIAALPTNRVYTFTVRARDRSGNVSGPTQVSAFLENTPPTAPANLRVIGTAGGYPVLGWDSATDNSGQIAWYVLSVDEGIHSVSTTGLSFRIVELVESCFLPPDREIHTFVLRAFDPSGNSSAPSNVLNVRIPITC
jgi:chitodextrinase